jgi:hypothetical protein
MPRPSELFAAGRIVAALVWAHQESVAVVRRLLLTQEAADECRAESEHAVDFALAHPGDPSAVHAVAEAQRRAAEADRYELEATQQWWAHIFGVEGLIAVAEKLDLGSYVERPSGEDESSPTLTSAVRVIHRRGGCGRTSLADGSSQGEGAS